MPQRGVENTLQLLDENCTIPFISRYRKEKTGNMDEVQVSDIALMREKLTDIAKRKETILSTIEAQSKLTDELRKRIEDCWTLSELEDIYLPYKPKRRTKADIARQNGLEPLANAILLQLDKNINRTAERFVKGEVKSMEEALEGAKFIIAEAVNENENVRKSVRSVYRREAVITSKVVKAKADTEEAQKYRDYFEFSESLRRCSSHRLLAMRRGEREGFLKVSISANDEVCKDKIKAQYVRGYGEGSKILSGGIASICAARAVNSLPRLPTMLSSDYSSLPSRQSSPCRANRLPIKRLSAYSLKTCANFFLLLRSDRSVSWV